MTIRLCPAALSDRFDRTARLSIALALAAVLAACGGDDNGLTGPSTRLQPGEWTGTTAQGQPVRFTVSGDEKVTEITIGYSFNGCAGSHTFSNLNVETAPTVICIPGPCSRAIDSFRALHYQNGAPGTASTSIDGLFLQSNRAEGQAHFRDYPGCDSALGVTWSAARR